MGYEYGNEAAYERAIARNIARNREKGRVKRAQAKAKEFMAVEGNMEFMAKLVLAANAEKNHGFLSKMVESFNEWGSLTDKQMAAVEKVLVSRQQQGKARAVVNEQLAAQSNHVGAEGDRLEFEMVLLRKFEFAAPQYAYHGDSVLHGHVMQDSDGNVLVYFGKDLGAAPGDKIAMRATVKRHEERDGVKQTVLSRPFKPVVSKPN